MTADTPRRSANRVNAQKSTGPSTPEGKSKSSRNSLTHGLCARDVLIPGENQARHDALRIAIWDEIQPESELEAVLCDNLVATQWSIERCQASEADALDQLAQSIGPQYENWKTGEVLARGPKVKNEDKPDKWWVEELGERPQSALAELRDTEKGRDFIKRYWEILIEQVHKSWGLEHKYGWLYFQLSGHDPRDLINGTASDALLDDYVFIVSLYADGDSQGLSQTIIDVGTILDHRDPSRASTLIERLWSRLVPREEGRARLDERMRVGPAVHQALPPLVPPPAPPAPTPPGWALVDFTKKGELRQRYLSAHQNAFSRTIRDLAALRKLRTTRSETSDWALEAGPTTAPTVAESAPLAEAVAPPASFVPKPAPARVSKPRSSPRNEPKPIPRAPRPPSIDAPTYEKVSPCAQPNPFATPAPSPSRPDRTDDQRRETILIM